MAGRALGLDDGVGRFGGEVILRPQGRFELAEWTSAERGEERSQIHVRAAGPAPHGTRLDALPQMLGGLARGEERSVPIALPALLPRSDQRDVRLLHLPLREGGAGREQNDGGQRREPEGEDFHSASERDAQGFILDVFTRRGGWRFASIIPAVQRGGRHAHLIEQQEEPVAKRSAPRAVAAVLAIRGAQRRVEDGDFPRAPEPAERGRKVEGAERALRSWWVQGFQISVPG